MGPVVDILIVYTVNTGMNRSRCAGAELKSLLIVQVY